MKTTSLSCNSLADICGVDVGIVYEIRHKLGFKGRITSTLEYSYIRYMLISVIERFGKATASTIGMYFRDWDDDKRQYVWDQWNEWMGKDE